MKAYGSLGAILISLSFLWVGVYARVGVPRDLLDQDEANGGVEKGRMHSILLDQDDGRSSIVTMDHDRRGLQSGMQEEGYYLEGSDEGLSMKEEGYGKEPDEGFSSDLMDSDEEGYDEDYFLNFVRRFIPNRGGKRKRGGKKNRLERRKEWVKKLTGKRAQQFAFVYSKRAASAKKRAQNLDIISKLLEEKASKWRKKNPALFQKLKASREARTKKLKARREARIKKRKARREARKKNRLERMKEGVKKLTGKRAQQLAFASPKRVASVKKRAAQTESEAKAAESKANTARGMAKKRLNQIAKGKRRMANIWKKKAKNVEIISKLVEAKASKWRKKNPALFKKLKARREARIKKWKARREARRKQKKGSGTKSGRRRSGRRRSGRRRFKRSRRGRGRRRGGPRRGRGRRRGGPRRRGKGRGRRRKGNRRV